jgi:hypothetical protein
MLFEKAVRGKVRFSFRGSLSVEDLWDLHVEDLDTIFKRLNRQAQAQEGESLLEEKDGPDEILVLKIAIVRHIVGVKLAEKKADEDAAMRLVKKQKLLGILAQKQDESLLGMDEAELQKLINEL